MTGRTRFSDKALTKVVNAAAASVPGSVKITSSWSEIGTRSYPRCEIRSDQLAGVIQVTSFIAVSWPSPATDVAEKVQRSIIAWVTAMTGLRCTQVNVTVEQAVGSGRRVHAAEVAAAAEAPRLHPVQVHQGLPVTSPVTARPLSVIAPTVAPARPVRSPITRPPVRLEPVAVPAPAPVRPVSVPPQRPVAGARVPAEPRVLGAGSPPPPAVRRPRAPRDLPLLPVQAPAPVPLRPVALPDTTVPAATVPAERALVPVYVRGVRFSPDAPKGRKPRVR